VRCIECVSRWPRDHVPLDELPPSCPSCGGLLKSDTVSFGEPIPPDVLERCQQEARTADCILVAGTSATVYPAAALPIEVLERGGTLIEVNPYETELSSIARVVVRGPAGDALPRIVAAARRNAGSA
jgi:NAD-dependent deacetylase